MRELIQEIGAYAGLVAFLGLAVLALLAFTQGRDLRRLREWAGSAPERDAERKEATSVVAAQRAEELRKLEEARTAEREATQEREDRRRRREEGLPAMSIGERVRDTLSLNGRLAEPRYLAALFVVVALIAGGVVYAVTQGDSEADGRGKHAKKSAAAPKPGEIEVTVLNGTAVPGLAASFGDEVERKGFTLGAITNSTSSFAESVVMFDNGSAPEAHRVAKALEISQVRPMTEDVEAVSAGAPVSVVVGEDNASPSG
ncbi:MAG TPA: LytR C-terminal domain-containing protein [Solirubrobacterales bacterium]|nr:LytR C-terminal domain-containing protein [Solirubrobacterales bacterium]